MRQITRLIDEAAEWLSTDLRRAIDTISLRQRQAIVLVYVVGMTGKEAAAALGVSEQVVSVAQKKGISRLRKIFVEEC